MSSTFFNAAVPRVIHGITFMSKQVAVPRLAGRNEKGDARREAVDEVLAPHRPELAVAEEAGGRQLAPI